MEMVYRDNGFGDEYRDNFFTLLGDKKGEGYHATYSVLLHGFTQAKKIDGTVVKTTLDWNRSTPARMFSNAVDAAIVAKEDERYKRSKPPRVDDPFDDFCMQCDQG